MDAQFWHDKWDQNDIGFHEADVNPGIITHFGTVAPPTPARVFVPLCGKTRDIAWLMGQGYHVVGAELSTLAITELFAELSITAQVADRSTGQHFAGPGIDIFVGDIFDLTSKDVGQIDVVYDRAALVALPSDLRLKYAAHIAELSGAAPQLLLCFEYDQTAMNGPPFAVDETEIQRVYGSAYDIAPLARKPISGRLKARLHASDLADHTAWALRPLGD
ncbi:MAG: thiopurine S-methyltransferase [Pseudomonadota bacterium]